MIDSLHTKEDETQNSIVIAVIKVKGCFQNILKGSPGLRDLSDSWVVEKEKRKTLSTTQLYQGLTLEDSV